MDKHAKSNGSSGEMVVFITPDENSHKALEAKSNEKDEWNEESEREHWSHGLDFILSLIGYAVGVGNLWRFPYLTLRNGGGAFLIPYFFFLILCGVPLFYLEVCLGQFSGTSSLFVWKMCPLFKGIGYCMVLVSGMACIYYNAVLSWVIYYLVNSFSSELPWGKCGQWWNTPTCIAHTGVQLQSYYNDSFSNSSVISLAHFAQNSSASGDNNLSYIDLSELGGSVMQLGEANASVVYGENSSFSVREVKHRTAAEEFWQFNVLRKSDSLDDLGSLQLHSAVCLLAAWVLVCLCLFKGVKSLGKVVYVTALMPYVLLTIFLIRGCMLPGAADGIIFYVKPDFEKLCSFTVWIEACFQVFYSLGPAWGGLITMSSFNKFHNHCLRDVIIASMADGLTSVYGGFVIFAVVGFMAREANVSVTDVATQGPGLALVAYPEAISKLPVPQLWAILFFLMLLCLGIDSQFGMFETVVAGLIDAFPHQLRKRRVWLTFGLALFSYLVSLPLATQGGIYVFTLLDWFVAAFCVIITSLLECIVIGWIYGVDRFCEDIELMLGKKPGIFVKCCWTLITPGILLTAFVFTCIHYSLPVYDEYKFPTYANVLGFLISVIPLIPIPVWMASVLYKERGTFIQRLRSSLRPADDWGPAAKQYKAMYKEKEEEYRQRSHWLIIIVRKIKL